MIPLGPNALIPGLLQPGDMVHVNRPGFVSTMIRWFSRRAGNREAWASHTEIVSTDTLQSIGAYHRTIQHPILELLPAGGVIIMRKPGLSVDQRDAVALKAEDYLGRKYGYGKIVLHAMDYLIGGAFFFRRIDSSDNYPICSWVAAYSYYKALGVTVCGVDPALAKPDDLLDGCLLENWIPVWADKQETLDSLGIVSGHDTLDR
jgi:hypothetical protein